VKLVFFKEFTFSAVLSHWNKLLFRKPEILIETLAEVGEKRV